MSRLSLYIPFRLTRENGFFNTNGAPQALFGYSATLKLEPPYSYLVLEEVPAEEAEAVLKRTRRCLVWASIGRLYEPRITCFT